MAAPQTLGLVGHGRFGAALAGLAEERGIRVRAFDPAADVPAALSANTLDELCAAVDVLVVGVPLERFDAVLSDLAPRLRPEHLVLDVGSVKVEPVRALRAHVDGVCAWAATHPLFGPTSLARGERPLRVVLCEGSDEGRRRAGALWRALGCECLEQSAEEHDRTMARTHALAFFLAKGLVDVGAGEDSSFTPPSFDAMAKTITAVRSDAGHLFRAIQLTNPFAARERARLLEALQRIHAVLAEPDDPASTDALAVPALPAEPGSAACVEAPLTELDAELVELLARRARLARRASSAELGEAGERLARLAAGAGIPRAELAALVHALTETADDAHAGEPGA